MALYTPPEGSKNPNANKLAHKDEEDPAGASKDNVIFYPRPSLGLRMWGPLVPASDNRAGLWSLVAAQTAVGLLCMKRFRSLGSRVIKRDISDFPSLNRFSTTHGNMYVTRHGATAFGGAHSFHRRVGARTGFFHSERFNTFKRVVYLLSGTLILSQSLLETCRLTILKYDPWCEEAKSVREKKFFNDIVKYYHEGVDPNRFKVKDASSGTTLPLNIPEVKQGVAVARAQAHAESIATKWFGPLEYKPMSFSDFLDRLEYYLDMSVLLQNNRTNNVAAEMLTKKISHSEEELRSLVENNVRNRKKAHDLLETAPKNSIPLTARSSDTFSKGIMLDLDTQRPEDIDLGEIWSVYNPWTDLALDTSLSIKFLPTVVMPEDTPHSASSKQQEEEQTEGGAASS